SMTAGGPARRLQTQVAPAGIIGTVVPVAGRDHPFGARAADGKEGAFYARPKACLEFRARGGASRRPRAGAGAGRGHNLREGGAGWVGAGGGEGGSARGTGSGVVGGKGGVPAGGGGGCTRRAGGGGGGFGVVGGGGGRGEERGAPVPARCPRHESPPRRRPPA